MIVKGLKNVFQQFLLILCILEKYFVYFQLVFQIITQPGKKNY